MGEGHQGGVASCGEGHHWGASKGGIMREGHQGGGTSKGGIMGRGIKGVAS